MKFSIIGLLCLAAGALAVASPGGDDLRRVAANNAKAAADKRVRADAIGKIKDATARRERQDAAAGAMLAVRGGINRKTKGKRAAEPESESETESESESETESESESEPESEL